MCAKFYFQFKSISRVVVAFAVSTLRYGAIAVGVAQLYEIMVLPSRATRLSANAGGNILPLVYIFRWRSRFVTCSPNSQQNTFQAKQTHHHQNDIANHPLLAATQR
jgi:hypothetical protein